METIDITTFDPTLKDFQLYFARYIRHKGYAKALDELPIDIISELLTFAVVNYKTRKIPIGQEYIVHFGEKAEIPCIKLSQYESAIKAEAIAEMMDTDVDSDEFQAIFTIANEQTRRISNAQWFYHPLSEVSDIEFDGNTEPKINLYLFYELLINYLRGFDSPIFQDPVHARQILSQAVLVANPTINLSLLLEKAIAGYEVELMRLATLFVEGMSLTSEKSLDQQNRG